MGSRHRYINWMTGLSYIERRTVASTESVVELILGREIDERWGEALARTRRLCRVGHSRRETKNHPCDSGNKDLLPHSFWNCVFIYSFLVCLSGRRTVLNFTRTYPQGSYTCNLSKWLWYSSLSLHDSRWLEVCNRDGACVYVYTYWWERGSAVIDETWKTTEEDFQSINTHRGCGLKAQSCRS